MLHVKCVIAEMLKNYHFHPPEAHVCLSWCLYSASNYLQRDIMWLLRRRIFDNAVNLCLAKKNIRESGIYSIEMLKFLGDMRSKIGIESRRIGKRFIINLGNCDGMSSAVNRQLFDEIANDNWTSIFISSHGPNAIPCTTLSRNKLLILC